MAKAKKRPLLPGDARISVDPVTHEKVVTILDPVQLALERCLQVIDGQRLKLSNGDAILLAQRLREKLVEMVPHVG